MGPSLPESKKNDSSESDDESNMRHDRFRSERFKEDKSGPTDFRSTENKYKHGDRYSSSKRIRNRSPERSHKRRERTEPSSSYRNELRSNHDRIDIQKPHRSKPSKNNKSDKSHKKYSNLNESEVSDSSKKKTNKLSTILRNFDEQLESKRINSENPLVIGPALPPQLKEKEDESPEKELLAESSIGPALPPRLMNQNINKKQIRSELEHELRNAEVGLTPHSNNETTEDKINPENSAAEGPALPPHIQNKYPPEEAQKCPQTDLKQVHVNDAPLLNATPETYGPALPPKVETDSYGPALPPNFKDLVGTTTSPSELTVEQQNFSIEDSSDDEETVGPLPEGKMNLTQYQLDLRAMDIRRKLEEEKTGTSKDIKKREEWMLELPPEKATNLGLGPRSFRMKAAPDMSNRSSWTDTPADKLRKEEQALKGEAEPVNSEEMMQAAFIQERNEAMDKMSQLSKDIDRPNSLLEMHQKKIKKKKKKEEKEGKKKERRPFDRNIDLQVNRFDDAQKKAIFKKAQLLDTRFSSGQSKYL